MLKSLYSHLSTSHLFSVVYALQLLPHYLRCNPSPICPSSKHTHTRTHTHTHTHTHSSSDHAPASDITPPASLLSGSSYRLAPKNQAGPGDLCTNPLILEGRQPRPGERSGSQGLSPSTVQGQRGLTPVPRGLVLAMLGHCMHPLSIAKSSPDSPACPSEPELGLRVGGLNSTLRQPFYDMDH